jgi:ABC-type transport system involved in cytochrome bd biosynthesis fused ATPase/permease subunit
MTENNQRSIGQILSEGANDFIRIGTEFLQVMLRLPVPALLIACLLLAIFLTILPLALGLFVIFLIIKLIIAVVSPKQQQHQHTDDA